MDMLWLAEHHFDGICAYVDPVTFAAALAASTERIGIGFAVAQMSLHHPIRMAEQMALIDNISRGRLLVGLGRGTAYNIYDYQGYGIDPAEAQDRLDEAEEVMIKAWTTENYEHRGKFWSLRLPLLRPRPYTRPHPPIIRACASEEAVVSMARAGRPFLMNVQSNEITRQRLLRYRETMRDCGFDEGVIARNVAQTWVWRNIFVAETDAEAERLALPAFQTQARLPPTHAPANLRGAGRPAQARDRAGGAQRAPARAAVRLARDRGGGHRRDRPDRRGRPDPGIPHGADAVRDRRAQHPALHAKGRPGVSRPARVTELATPRVGSADRLLVLFATRAPGG